jgi:membrane-bound ClpP family serine protease
MMDYILSGVAYLIGAVVLWFYARRSKSGYLRWQWRRPQWMLARLLVVVAICHGVFGWLGLSAGNGYAIVAVLAGLCVIADFTGVFALLAGAVGFIFREWVFWFPARHELILRTRKSIEVKEQEHLVGQWGQTLSDLKLAGKIEINGQKFYARSESGFVRKGEKVMVSSVGDFELVVRPVDYRTQSSGGGAATHNISP